jgi:serine/threonine-protein kinase RsbW
MSSPPTVRLVLGSRAENVALIRELLSGLGEAAALEPILDDVKTAVSEAANNVVVHAYDGQEGPLEVELRIAAGRLEVLVRDHGKGIGTLTRAEAAASERMDELGPGHGLGLAVMGALADELELRERRPSGTDVLMSFVLPPGAGEPPAAIAALPAEPSWSVPQDGTVQLVLAPASLARLVLARVVCAAAARAGFSVDRLSDAQLIADALAAELRREPILELEIEGRGRRLELELGPLSPGAGAAALERSTLGELGSVIGRLADEVEVREAPGGERLRVVLADR